jgi:hypothetical protein
MTFRRAVRAVAQLAGAYRRELEALRNVDTPRVLYNKRNVLKGSVNLDEALKAQYHDSPRWDYGIGHYNGNSEEAIWVEVHRASADEVDRVIRKAEWLHDWLSANARDLFRLTRDIDGYVWLSAGGVLFQHGSPQAHKLAQAGVRFPQKHLQL